MFSQQARTRAVLGALGIPLWGVRAVSPQSVVVVPILGKHESDCEHIQDQMIHAKSNAKSNTIVNKSSIKTLDSIKIMESVDVGLQTITHVVAQPTAHVIVSNASLQPSIKASTKVQAVEKTTRLPFADVIAASESIHVEHLIRFSLEARVIGQWVVLVSVQALNHPDRNTLWKNIGESLLFKQDSQEVCRFDWPLAEGVRWQQNVGAQSALMGFLTRFGSERRMGLMGELPDAIIPDYLERFPSLDELLREPLKKRSFWRLLSGTLR